MSELERAYRTCEQITWSQARNFAYGIRLLPPAKRRGLAVIYAYARRIDDIGDGDLAPEAKAAALAEQRELLRNLAEPPADPVLVALADTARQFPLVPVAAFEELIDGCLADVTGTEYRTFEDLHRYCRQVAGSIGRLSLGIFGYSDERAPAVADALGVALQLTNIIRDIAEDFNNDRVYLPAEDLAKFDVDLARPGPGEFRRLLDFQVNRARDWYGEGLALLPMLDRRSAACTGTMAGIYRRLLEQIAADPVQVLNRRVSLPVTGKLLVALTALTRPGRIR